jgi:hypothetical protein
VAGDRPGPVQPVERAGRGCADLAEQAALVESEQVRGPSGISQHVLDDAPVDLGVHAGGHDLRAAPVDLDLVAVAELLRPDREVAAQPFLPGGA